MNAQKTLGAELLAALGIATIGAGKFPPPHRYTGVFLLWFVLGLIAQAGNEAARVATALGGLVVLTMAMGTAGKNLLGWFGGVQSRLGAGSPTQAPSGPPAPIFPNPRAGGRPRQRPT